MKKALLLLGICILLIYSKSSAQKAKFGINFTYDLYGTMEELEGIKSSWRSLYLYNSSLYSYDLEYRYWPYDQLNMDISMQLGSKVIVIEPFFSFTIIKGWYGVSFDDGKYVADEPILYIPESVNNPIFIDGEEYLYARGSARLGQKRFGANLMLGDEIQIGTGIWWQRQNIELHKSMAYNRYWYSGALHKPNYDAYVTYDGDIYVNEPVIEKVKKNRVLFPLILRYSNGPFSSHITFIFQKPFQLLMGCGVYF
jgi:hypothetical protein